MATIDAGSWPELDWNQWQATQATLHLWTQMVGKTRLALTPLANHWWNVPLYCTVRGLTTSPMPLADGGALEIEFDFQTHVLELRRDNGRSFVLQLQPRTVKDFFAAYREALRALGVEVAIWPMPVELQSPTRFDEDEFHCSYDREAVERFHHVLLTADRLFERFACGFTGKISPVHFFWGSFDLCVTRFSGRLAGGPPKTDPVQQEAYSHEVSSCGFWPGNGGLGHAAFYTYAAPVPAGLAERPVQPGGWNEHLGEFLLAYDDARQAADPDAAVLAFLESATPRVRMRRRGIARRWSAGTVEEGLPGGDFAP